MSHNKEVYVGICFLIGENMKVKLKIAIAYVIENMELHDKLCGKIQSKGW